MSNSLFLIRVVAVVFLTAYAAIASAQVKIGYINLQTVSNEAPQAQRAQKKLKAEFEKREQEIQRLLKSRQAMQERMEKEGMTMSETEVRSREREFAEISRELQRKQREYREDWSLRLNEELASLYEAVNKVIKKIAETEKYDLIVQEAVHHSAAIDITPKVIKALGEVSGSGATK